MIKLFINNNEIKCEISNDLKIDKKHFPLKFQVTQLITNKVLWETEVEPGMWASWPNIRDINSRVVTNQNIILKELNYSYHFEDLPLYEFWDYFCRLHKNSKGLILGCGDGTWGERIIPVNRENINCHLVEASKKTFSKLKENYGNKSNFTLHNDLLSTDGGEYKFYEGNHDEGLNTINFEYLKKADNNAQSKYELKKSKNIIDFIKEIGKVDWVRIDLEGIDYDILKSLPIDFLSSLILIQYEHWFLEDSKKTEIDRIFYSLGFKKIVYNIDTIYFK